MQKDTKLYYVKHNEDFSSVFCCERKYYTKSQDTDNTKLSSFVCFFEKYAYVTSKLNSVIAEIAILTTQVLA
jgi:hypothetical protein